MRSGGGGAWLLPAHRPPQQHDACADNNTATTMMTMRFDILVRDDASCSSSPASSRRRRYPIRLVLCRRRPAAAGRPLCSSAWRVWPSAAAARPPATTLLASPVAGPAAARPSRRPISKRADRATTCHMRRGVGPAEEFSQWRGVVASFPCIPILSVRSSGTHTWSRGLPLAMPRAVAERRSPGSERWLVLFAPSDQIHACCKRASHIRRQQQQATRLASQLGVPHQSDDRLGGKWLVINLRE